MFVINIENLKKLKYHMFFKKNLLSICFLENAVRNIKKYLKKKNQYKY